MGVADSFRTRQNSRHDLEHVRGLPAGSSQSVNRSCCGSLMDLKSGWLPMWKNIVETNIMVRLLCYFDMIDLQLQSS